MAVELCEGMGVTGCDVHDPVAHSEGYQCPLCTEVMSNYRIHCVLEALAQAVLPADDDPKEARRIAEVALRWLRVEVVEWSEFGLEDVDATL